MTRSVLADAFDHHVWATLVVLDQLAALSDDQLATAIPGTYGTIMDTARHLVGADRWYLFTLTNGAVEEIEESSMGVAALRAAMEPDGAHWLAQAIHHGTDHRSQLCTGLTALGIEPPEIDVWEWAKTPGKYWYIDAPVAAGG
jgi:uncharacterized damage-inducible protein DinB